MPATNQNFSMHAGDAKELLFTVTDDAGAVVDLTGMSALWLLSRHPSDAAPLLVKDVTINEASPPAGIITVQLLEADTSALEYAAYYFQTVLLDGQSPPNQNVVSTGWVDLRPRLPEL